MNVDVAAIQAVWEQGKRARAEYAAHPFARWQGIARDCRCEPCCHAREYARTHKSGPMRPDDSRHGTYSGVQVHRRAGEKPCRPCLDAEAAYLRQWRQESA